MNRNSSIPDWTESTPDDTGGLGRLRNQKGIALLVALIVVVLMVTLVVEFDYGTRVSLNTAGTFRDGIQAMYLAKSGVAAARAVLVDDATTSPVFDSLDELWANPLPPYPVGNGTVSITIQDERSRLNLNLLGMPSTCDNKWCPIFERLFKNLEIDTEVLWAIKDWIDEDDEETNFSGAESSFYLRLDPPYGIKNGPMDSFGELLLIKGVTQEVYNTLLIGCDGGPCVTVVPVSSKVQDNSVNLNTISLPVCEALHEDLNETLCGNLVNGRPILDLDSNLKAVPGWGDDTTVRFGSKEFINVKSNLFSIRSIAAVQETQRIVEAVVRRDGRNTTLVSWRLR